MEMIWLALKKYTLKIKGGQIKKQLDGLPWAFIQKYLGSGLHPKHPGLFPLSQSSFPARIPSPQVARFPVYAVQTISYSKL
jgi:hypothetical protein